ncbi:uncharacterized protein LOC131284610 [Anopheles ziemanni]|uniref:uncharacterized protein LOC131259783 n=1 Tax=Anopheles coustani TaxID=139045 RepID=UPI0026590CFC|nr:uncharacterized protein LOC131259783 [Anopheles coustani]XP_058169455.1 uncharacterized protein LOC131284610 [Anopheles ziemanni]
MAFDSEANGWSELNNFSLTIYINLLELTDPKTGDEATRFKLFLNCGKTSVDASGTLESLNEEKLANIIGLHTNAEQFVRFLNESSVEVTLMRDNSTVGRGQLRLKDTGAVHFDPKRVIGDPVLEKFALLNGNDEPIGMVTMVLRAERSAVPSAESGSEVKIDTNDLLYVVNEDRRRTSEQQENLQRQLLVCNKCNILRSSDDFSCQYELIHGILHSKAVNSTQKEIERIKQKLNDVKLDETIGHRESVSTNGDVSGGKICGLCRGITITGVTCGLTEPSVAESKPSTGNKRHVHRRSSQRNFGECMKAKQNSKPSARCCVRCKTSLNWMPEVCRCPKCGHKALKTEYADLDTNKRRKEFPNFPFDEGIVSNKTNSPMMSGTNTLVASSNSCSICHIRRCRCVDCAYRTHHSEPCSSLTGTSEILNPGYDTPVRPITRHSTNLHERQKGLQEGKVLPVRPPSPRRSEQLRRVYTARQGPKAEPQPTNGKIRLSGPQIRRNYNAFMRKVRQQNKNLYSYRFGRRHPGISVGHKSCMKQDPLVPAHMGWRWNTCIEGIGKRRPGWRPGAVRKPIMQLMQHFLTCYPMDNVPVSGPRGTHHRSPATGDHLAEQKPTLHITKQHGEYSITMNPLKDSETLKTTTDPYLPCKPIKFRLSKDPRLTKLYMLRDELKKKGLTLCGCRELENCEHRSEREKRILVEEIRRTGKRLGLPLDTTAADMPSRSESELDVEFTPPSAIIRPDARQPDVIFAETQYCEDDFKLKPSKKQDPQKAVGNSKVQGSRGSKTTGSRTPGVGSGHGKGDGVMRAPTETNAKQPKGDGANRAPKETIDKLTPGSTGQVRKSIPPKGGDAAKKGKPTVSEAKSTGVRISVAKAKVAAKK